MINLNDYINKDNTPIEEKIKKSIEKTKIHLSDLTTTSTCMIYSSYLYSYLKKENVVCHIIDTNDLGIEYKHRFILIPNNENYYLVDLTFSQFGNTDILNDLSKNGYDLMNEEKWKIYLEIISNYKVNYIDIDEAFFRR